MDGAEMVVDPRQRGIVDAISGDKQVFWMVTLRGDKLGDG